MTSGNHTSRHFSNVENRERTPFQSPVGLRSLNVDQQVLALHRLQESLTCLQDLQAASIAGRDLTVDDLGLLETRIRATMSALRNTHAS
jgi:hypothetical protein